MNPVTTAEAAGRGDAAVSDTAVSAEAAVATDAAVSDAAVSADAAVAAEAAEQAASADPAASAARPVILAVDDDPQVLAAVIRDLKSGYGADYRVVGAASGDEALELLRELRRQGQPVALVVADQRMPGMSGIRLLGEAAHLVPAARRVLLTAYADSEVAIQGINEVRLDHYLTKPWGPAEEGLLPYLSDLLADWRAQHIGLEVPIRVVGHHWSAQGHRLRDFLARNLVPFRWMDAEEDPEAARLLAAAELGEPCLPVAFLPDGAVLERPSHLEIARRIGLHTPPAAEAYDLVVVGAGPAGLAAGVYAASDGLRTLIVERDAPGGQAGRSRNIENYLGFPAGLAGGDLARRAVAQARRFGAELLSPVGVEGLRSQGGYHTLALSDGTSVTGRAVLVASGVAYRTLNVPGAEPLTGRGVYYGAAVSEALAVQDRDVFVLGGGNSAGQAALYLARFARTVTLLVRKSRLEAAMSRYLIRQVEAQPNIGLRLATELLEVQGHRHVEALVVQDAGADAPETLPTSGLFVFIGATAQTDWLGPEVARDPRGFIVAGPHLLAAPHLLAGRHPLAHPGTPSESHFPASLRDLAPGANGDAPAWPLAREPLWLETSLPGVFTAGDVRHRSEKGVAAAVGEGAMAMQLIRRYLTGSILAPGGGDVRRRPRGRGAARAGASPQLAAEAHPTPAGAQP